MDFRPPRRSNFGTIQRKKKEESSKKNGTRSAVYWRKMDKKDILGKKKQMDLCKVGLTYKGEWKDNKKHGFGCQIWSKGNKYEGLWEMGMRHGRGSYWIVQGKKLRKEYSGSWVKDKKHGLGVFFYKNGDRYEGQWKLDKRDGKGTLFTAEGDQYNGVWRNDKQCGFGRFIKSNGDVYRGQWLNGKREGSGIFYYKSKNKIYDGEWVNDQPKCGIYCEAKAYLTKEKSLDRKFKPIPILELKDADNLLVKRIEQIEKDRFGIRYLDFIDLEKQFTAKQLDEMRRIFSIADTNKNKKIDISELSTLFQKIQIPGHKNQLDKIMSDLDKNKDGHLNFEEFVKGVHLLRYYKQTESYGIDCDTEIAPDKTRRSGRNTKPLEFEEKKTP